MRAPRPASILLALLLCGAAPVARGQVGDPASRLQEAMAAYLTDPAGNATAFLEIAREEGGTHDPVQALFLGDAALRAGQNQAAEEFFALARDTGASPGFAAAAEIGLAWASLGRGRLRDAYQHFDVAGSTSPELRAFADVAMAFVGAAAGIPEARAALAAAAARPDVDPAFREVAPLLDAYGRYWSGDVAGAADAFTAFAIAAPDSRFADDALYAAAQAKQRLGHDAEARADLEALAGDGAPVHASSRLVRLDGRALVREGMRRDRDLGTRVLSQRVADILDGDGGRLARAALTASAARSAAGDERGGMQSELRERGTGASAHMQPDGERTLEARRSAGELARADGAPDAPAAGDHARRPAVARFPWTMAVALAIPLLLLAYWLLGRGRAQSR